MRLVLDEMYSDTISSELRKLGVDAVSIHDRAQLEGSSDEEVMRVAIAERRVLVTNNVRDYAPLVEEFGLRGETHFGVMFTDDVTFPRTRAGIGLLVRALAALAAGSTDDAMLDGCQYRNASSRRAQLSASRHLARRHEVDRWIKRIRSSSGSEWVCSSGQPYLTPVPDPADRAVAAPLNPRASWTVTFTSSDVRSAVLRCGGPDIGALQAVDLSNQVPPGVGHPISVRVFGSAANADLRADELLRTCLGLRSTMVRLTPF